MKSIPKNSINILLKHGVDEGAKLLGVHRRTAVRYLREYRLCGDACFSKREKPLQDKRPTSSTGQGFDYEETGDGAKLSGKIASSHTDHKLILDDFLAMAKVDLEVYEVERYRVGAWDTSMKLQDEKKVKFPHTVTNYVISVTLKRKALPVVDKEQFIKDLVSQVQVFSKPVAPYIYPKLHKGPGHLFVPALFDIHLGRQSWPEEVLVDYNIKIARDNFLTGIHTLISHSQGYKIDEILFVVGQDLFNFSVPFPFAMTDSGTPQENDGRWQKVFRIGQDLILEATRTLSSIAKTKVLLIPGNHDTLPVFFLGELLSKVFDGNKNIIVDNRPIRRKYFEYHNNLIGFSHGNKENERDWHAIMAAEQPESWGRTQYRYIYLGHKHHERSVMQQAAEKGPNRVIMPVEYNVDYKGVHVEYVPNLAQRHDYEHNYGFVGTIRAAKAFIHSHDQGRIAAFTYNLPIEKQTPAK